MAEKWIQQEVAWYKDSSPFSKYKPIDNEGKHVVDSSHLAKATKEYVERFAFCTQEEDAAASGKFSGSPYLLVATNVKSTWTVSKEFAKFHFKLVAIEDTSALFITFMPGIVHGTVDGALAGWILKYLGENNLDDHVSEAHSGGGTYQPDIRLFPEIPDPAGPHQDLDQDYDRAQSRVVIEFEFGNRNASALRSVGFTVLNNDYGALFVGIKIWKKDRGGFFGAAAVLWGKDHATGTISISQAFDFGTKELSTQSKDAWSHAGPIMLPPVPVGSWLRPLPLHVIARPPIGQPRPAPQQAWCLVLRKDLMFYRMPSSSVHGSPYIPNALPALQDCVIDLQRYQRKIHHILG
jgi:hypothetical protein